MNISGTQITCPSSDSSEEFFEDKYLNKTEKKVMKIEKKIARKLFPQLSTT